VSEEPKQKKLCYVKSSLQESIFGVDASFLDYLAKNPLYFREKEVLSFYSPEVETLSFKIGPNVCDLAYRDYAWRMDRPVKADANDDGVTDLVSELSSLEVEKFLTQDEKMLEVYGLDKPAIELVIGFSEEEGEPKKEPQTLYVGKALPDNTYTARVKGSPLIFTISKQVYDLLTQELHSVEVFDFDPERVTKISIRGASSLVLEKKDASWVPEPEGVSVSLFKTEEFIEDFSELSTKEYVDYKAVELQAYGLDTPAVTLEFSFPEEAQALMIGAKQDGAYYARKSGQPGVFLLDAEIVEPLFAPEGIFAKEERKTAGEEITTEIKVRGGQQPEPEEEEEPDYHLH
jgi:hypothetical protein